MCTFDIYGYVYGASRDPLAGVTVHDEFVAVLTDSNGFYDIEEDAPGGHNIGAEYSRYCFQEFSDDNDTIADLENGGNRHDFTLNCRP